MPSLTSAPAPRVVSNDPSVAKKPTTARNIKVGVWTLRSTEFTELEPPEKTESLFTPSFDESVVGEDNRKRVNKKDLMPGGKYRCKPSWQSRLPRESTSNQTIKLL